MELAYAPPAKARSRWVWVILVGLITTAITLFVVGLLDRRGKTNVMGWYVNRVLPVGAILVGLAASSGYALASWWFGVKVRRGLLWGVLGLMVVAYFAAEYVEFRSLGPLGVPAGTFTVASPKGGPPRTLMRYRRLGFWEYFHLRAVNWRWKKENSSEPEGEPLGWAGYIFRLLAVAGFSLSGLIIPWAVGKQPYCELCERYMRNKALATLPTSVPLAKISKKDVAARAAQEREMSAAAERATAQLHRMAAAAQAGDVAAFRAALASEVTPKAANKLPRRVRVGLIYCPSCASGYVQPVVVVGQGKQVSQTPLARVELTQDFVRGVRGEGG